MERSYSEKFQNKLTVINFFPVIQTYMLYGSIGFSLRHVKKFSPFICCL